jgi:rubrerythrin
MTEPRRLPDSAAVLAELTDLLQLEADALAAYAVAVAQLRRPEFREAVQAFTGDHLRHARDLSAAIRELGGVPLALPHVPTGLLKLGVQLAGAGWPWDDRGALLAFVSNEWQTREKYARAAARPHAPALAALLERHAQDEARHYGWGFDTLRGLGCGPETVIGQATQAFARLHGTAADALEAFGRLSIEAAARALEQPLGSAVSRDPGRRLAPPVG